MRAFCGIHGESAMTSAGCLWCDAVEPRVVIGPRPPPLNLTPEQLEIARSHRVDAGKLLARLHEELHSHEITVRTVDLSRAEGYFLVDLLSGIRSRR